MSTYDDPNPHTRNPLATGGVMDRTDEDRAFCENCGVTMDLHPGISGDEWECNVARQKADTMARFFGIFAR